MKYETLIGAAVVAAAIVAAGAMNRYQVAGAGGAAILVDGLTGDVRFCRDYGSVHEALCENPAQFRDPSIHASDSVQP